ncbi:MAG TPA: FRG domain-containing protein [Fimbriimonadaceae bacterium]
MGTSDSSLYLTSKKAPSSTTEHTRHYFRGMPDISYGLVPKISRAVYGPNLTRIHGARSTNELQQLLIYRLIRYAEQYRPDASYMPKSDDFLSWLCLAQHHNLPTYLLDWSLNSLVGLFFACYNTQEQEETKDGIIWVMKLKHKNDRIGGIIHMERAPVGHTDRHEAKRANKESNLTELISGECHVNIPVIIVPRILTRRIEAQAARFIFNSTEKPVDDFTGQAECAWSDLVPRFTVPFDKKLDILRELIDFRIHEGSMYADLDGYAKYLAHGGL